MKHSFNYCYDYTCLKMTMCFTLYRNEKNYRLVITLVITSSLLVITVECLFKYF